MPLRDANLTNSVMHLGVSLRGVALCMVLWINWDPIRAVPDWVDVVAFCGSFVWKLRPLDQWSSINRGPPSKAHRSPGITHGGFHCRLISEETACQGTRSACELL